MKHVALISGLLLAPVSFAQSGGSGAEPSGVGAAGAGSGAGAGSAAGSGALAGATGATIGATVAIGGTIAGAVATVAAGASDDGDNEPPTGTTGTN